MMLCKDCDLIRDAIVGKTCPFREHVDPNGDACDTGMARAADREARDIARARGRGAALAYEQAEPHGSE